MKKKNLSARFIGRFSSIQSVIFATVAVLVLSAVVIVTGVSMRFTNTSIFENSSQYTQTIIQQMNQNIDSYIDYMENIAYLISSNEDVQDYLFSDEIDSEGRYRILKQFETILDSRSDIRNVGIISKSGRMLINNGSKSVNHDLNINTQEWYTQALNSPEGPTLTSSHVQHIISGERPWVITLSRGIRDRSGSGEKEGVFFIDLNYSAISGLCDQSTVGTKGYAFILDAKGNIVYHPQQQLIYSGFKEEKGMDLKEGTHIQEQAIYTVKNLENCDWKIVGVCYVDEMITEKVSSAVSRLLIVLCLVMGAVFLLGWAFSELFSAPVRQLADDMHRFEKNAENFVFEPMAGTTEITTLSNSFEHMVVKIQKLMEQVRQEEITLRKTELKALQAQINPHFLYNTLAANAWMCEDGKNEDAEEMVTALARLFRISISKGHELIPIEKEVEHAKSYLKIENYRYKNKFTYSFEVEESCLSYLCNKITLQPIIENAIYHGVKQMIDEGEIWIRIFEDGEDIIFQVEDNGIGMTEEQCREILRKEPGDRTGIGIKNVNDRIKIYFGSNYGLNITSELDEGTCVTIRMPKVREEEYEKK